MEHRASIKVLNIGADSPDLDRWFGRVLAGQLRNGETVYVAGYEVKLAGTQPPLALQVDGVVDVQGCLFTDDMEGI